MKLSRLTPFALSSLLWLCANTLAQDQKPVGLPLFPVKVDGKWGFIDTSGKLRIPAQYSDVNEFGELTVEGAAVAMGPQTLLVPKAWNALELEQFVTAMVKPDRLHFGDLVGVAQLFWTQFVMEFPRSMKSSRKVRSAILTLVPFGNSAL